jgi:HPt (histidine-containing phosphotransfer) domain-containing protein
LTANALKGDSEKYLAAGMTDYLAKPFDEERLFRVISRNLVRRSAVAVVPTAEPGGPIQAAGPGGSIQAIQATTIPINNYSNMLSSNIKLYDLSMVESVSGGDEGFIKKMVALFIETVPQNLQDLISATTIGNWEQVGKTAHKLKSTVDSMGIKSIRQEIRTVEANARQKQSLEEIPSLVERIDAVIRQTIDQLQAEIAN